MYSAAVIARAQATLEAAYRQALPDGLIRYPVDLCAAMTDRLAAIPHPKTRRPTRRLTPEEDRFIANERLLTKIDFRYWGERYCFINAGAQGLQRLYPLWESQTIVLSTLADLQDRRIATGHPDGLLVNILKARQEGISTLGAALVTHRVVTHSHVRTLLASDVPDNSGSEGLFGMYERIVANLPWWLRPAEQYHAKHQHIIFDNGSAILVESGKSMKGALQDKGGTKGQLGRSRTYSVVHLTELSTWETPEQIDDSLMPAVPRSPRTLGIKESTAKGRHNWHHEDWLLGVATRGRWLNIFIPWYALAQNALPAPLDWSPSEVTLAHAAQAELEGPKWLGRPLTLTADQLYWYEETKFVYQAKEQLARFLEEYAADPESCFQHSGRSVFTLDALQYLDRLAKPPIDVWSVDPAKDLRDIRVDELARIAAEHVVEAAVRVALANKPREADGTEGDRYAQ